MDMPLNRGGVSEATLECSKEDTFFHENTNKSVKIIFISSFPGVPSVFEGDVLDNEGPFG